MEDHRPLPNDVNPDDIDGMIPTLRRLLMIDADDALAHGSLKPLKDWATGMRSGGRALAGVADAGSLHLGMRSVLSRIIPFHWNRMGFTSRRQSLWSRGARRAVLD